MRYLQKIKDLLKAENIDFNVDGQHGDYTDRVDEYFFNNPDPKLFKGCDTEDGRSSFCGYFTFMIEDCFAGIPNYEITEQDALNFENFIKVTR